jgi:hypothetical protein
MVVVEKLDGKTENLPRVRFDRTSTFNASTALNPSENDLFLNPS